MNYIYGCQRAYKDLEKVTEPGQQPRMLAYHTDPIVVATEQGESFYKQITADGPGELIHDKDNETPYCLCLDHKHQVWVQTDAEIRQGCAVLNGNTSYIAICSKVAQHPDFYNDKPAIVVKKQSGSELARGVKINGRFNVIFKEHEPQMFDQCPCGKQHAHRTWIETDAEIELITD